VYITLILVDKVRFQKIKFGAKSQYCIKVNFFDTKYKYLKITKLRKSREVGLQSAQNTKDDNQRLLSFLFSTYYIIIIVLLNELYHLALG